MTLVAEAEVALTDKETRRLSLTLGLQAYRWYLTFFAVVLGFLIFSEVLRPNVPFALWVFVLVLALYPLFIIGWRSLFAAGDVSREQRLVSWQFFQDRVEMRAHEQSGCVHWSAFSQIRETGSYLLFYRNRRIFAVLPKRAFTNADAVVAVRRLAQEHLKRRAKVWFGRL